ncbi:hypothetical protein E2C01_000509 [Portunus trituberculatus]|uniref:Uncharacterized protein n=1 Tax=Portunus trituberculatus TaxID=210409 RepID=A0A5B7CGR7_PORTR|nr:hypothetical protein [Portunus trituberculatus]
MVVGMIVIRVEVVVSVEVVMGRVGMAGAAVVAVEGARWMVVAEDEEATVVALGITVVSIGCPETPIRSWAWEEEGSVAAPLTTIPAVTQLVSSSDLVPPSVPKYKSLGSSEGWLPFSNFSSISSTSSVLPSRVVKLTGECVSFNAHSSVEVRTEGAKRSELVTGDVVGTSEEAIRVSAGVVCGGCSQRNRGSRDVWSTVRRCGAGVESSGVDTKDSVIWERLGSVGWLRRDSFHGELRMGGRDIRFGILLDRYVARCDLHAILKHRTLRVLGAWGFRDRSCIRRGFRQWRVSFSYWYVRTHHEKIVPVSSAACLGEELSHCCFRLVLNGGGENYTCLFIVFLIYSLFLLLTQLLLLLLLYLVDHVLYLRDDSLVGLGRQDRNQGYRAFLHSGLLLHGVRWDRACWAGTLCTGDHWGHERHTGNVLQCTGVC